MTLPLPKKLGKEPLVDAVFELRFKASASASSILPGALFGALGGGSALKVVRLPASQIPEAMRAGDPLLRSAPLLSLEWQDYNILVGDESVGLACRIPYLGWDRFKPAIVEVVECVMKVGILQGIERYSLKYVDLIPITEFEGQVRALNWDVRIGNHKLQKEVSSLRIEIPRDEFLHLVSVQTGAVVTLQDARQLVGLALDVDTIFRASTISLADFLPGLSDGLERLHSSNKAMFFECLTPETITNLEPTYD